MEPVIIPFRPEQLAEVQTFLRVALRDDRFRMDFETRDSDLKDIATHYQTRGGQFWVLLAGTAKAVIGCIALERVNNKTLELKRFVVDEPMRNHGYGERLLRTALNFAAAAECNRIRLYLTDRHEIARHMMKKFRFHEIKRYTDHEHALYFFEHRIQDLPPQ